MLVSPAWYQHLGVDIHVCIDNSLIGFNGIPLGDNLIHRSLGVAAIDITQPLVRHEDVPLHRVVPGTHGNKLVNPVPMREHASGYPIQETLYGTGITAPAATERIISFQCFDMLPSPLGIAECQFHIIVYVLAKQAGRYVDCVHFGAYGRARSEERLVGSD